MIMAIGTLPVNATVKIAVGLVHQGLADHRLRVAKRDRERITAGRNLNPFVRSHPPEEKRQRHGHADRQKRQDRLQSRFLLSAHAASASTTAT